VSKQRTGGGTFLVAGIAVLALAALWSAGLAVAYFTVETTASELKGWIADRDQTLREIGIEPAGKSQEEIANALVAKFTDDIQKMRRFESSIVRRSSIYGQVKDRPEVDLMCYVFAFKSPQETVLAIAEGGFAAAFWPGIAQVAILAAAGLFLCCYRRRPVAIPIQSTP